MSAKAHTRHHHVDERKDSTPTITYGSQYRKEEDLLPCERYCSLSLSLLRGSSPTSLHLLDSWSSRSTAALQNDVDDSCGSSENDPANTTNYDSEGYAVLAPACLDDKKPRTWLLHCLKWIRMSRRIWRILPSEVYKQQAFCSPTATTIYSIR
jgi:hypothetical protein